MEGNMGRENGGQRNVGNEDGIEDVLDSNSEIEFDDMENSEISDKEFFNDVKKVVMKSLKRKIRRQTCRQEKKKRARIAVKPAIQDVQDCVPRASSRCNVGYLFEVIQSFSHSQEKKQLVMDAGFGAILFFDGCLVPRSFAQYIAENTSVEGEYILIHTKQITLSAADVHDVLGIPVGKHPIPLDDMNGKSEFLALFGLSEMPTIKFFGDLIIRGSVDGDQFLRCFLVVVLATFLCPTSSTKPSTKYLGSLIDIEKIKDLQWCNLTHDWLLAYIGKYQKDRMKVHRVSSTLGGCIYQLAVRCLDNLDFGPLELPRTLPRIYVWKAGLIKDFSKMDLQESGKYGARKVKDQGDVWFIPGPGLENTKPSTTARAYINIRETLEPLPLNSAVKDDIASSFESFMVGENHSFHVKAQNVVMDVIMILLNKKSTSGETEVVANSEHEENSVKARSVETLKVNSEGDAEGEDDASHASSRERHKEAPAENDVGLQFLCLVSKITDNNLTGRMECLECKPVGQNHAAKGAEAMHTIPNFNGAIYKPESSASLAHLASVRETTKDDFDTECNSNAANCNNQTRQNGERRQYATHGASEDAKVADICLSTMFSLAQKADFLNSTTKASDPQTRSEGRGKKYVFYDKSTPSFRLLDFLDEEGNYIEEPELRRPVGFDFQDNVPTAEPRNLNTATRGQGTMDAHDKDANAYYGSQAEQKKAANSIPAMSSNDTVYESELHIQCAQKSKSYNDCHSPNSISPIKPTDLFNAAPESPEVEFIRETRCEMDYTDNHEDLQLSQEVIFLGERKFNDTCNVLCNKTNEYYNTVPHDRRYITGSEGSSHGKENAMPKRLCQPSKYMYSPYETVATKAPSRGEFRFYDAIAKLATNDDHKHRLAFCIDNVRVSHEVFGNSMKRGGWVEANIINAFCRQLFREQHPSRSNRHCFFHCSSEYFLQKYRTEARKRKMKELVLHSFVGAGSAKALHLTDLLCFPSLWSSHWFLFVVDVIDEKFIFLDSLMTASSDYHRGIDSMMIKNFVDTWNESGAKEQPFSEFHIVYPKVPTQGNTDDCGIYVMKFMELWSPRNQQACVFPRSDVPNFRVKLANRLMFSTHNIEHEAKKRVMTFSEAQ